MTPSADGANTITFKAETKDEGSGVATLPLCQRLPASATAAIAFVSTPARVCSVPLWHTGHFLCVDACVCVWGDIVDRIHCLKCVVTSYVEAGRPYIDDSLRL